MTLAAAPSLSSLVRLKKLFNELNLDRVIDVPVYQDVLAWDVFRAGRFESCLCALFLPSKSDTVLVSAMLKDVDCLLIAKPVATNYLGIRRDCAIVVRLWPVVGSSLQGPPSLLLDCDRGKRVPNCVRSGNKVFWPLVLGLCEYFRGKRSLPAVESIQSCQ
jgi:hypothetical protein